MPIFAQGRDRFPVRSQRFHAPSKGNPHRHEVLPGPFEHFNRLWTRAPIRIDDAHIRTIQPEPMYTGIHYRVDIHPLSWGQLKLKRGRNVVFRGFENDNIKYIVTWEHAHELQDGIAYVQLSAMRHDEYAVESSDADWPTIGIFVPNRNSDVLPAPEPVFTVPPIFTDPFSPQPLPSTYNDHLALAKVNRQIALNATADSPSNSSSSSSAPIRWLKRKFSDLGCGN